ncbi:FAD-dependent oxidoreductase [Cytophagales bacterium LB-30]|uniref:FAD-dependent oxidoreductase n=1 Tax=Shiella aurantiaca TaxID=3058365 RepID=A0ABT8F2L5_9BACT|nr:FAD-dependent oxidoreductase [Shiella aurantiaca]MDN4164701.1 FAD-dependent oxidoreductase [Shiella aurantiaca]
MGQIMEEKPYLIVGQGLAGSLLGYELLKACKKVLLVDPNEANTSSKVAAGLYNPITGKKMQKTWLADTLFPFLEHYYSEVEQTLGIRALFPMGIYRPFLSLEEQNDWMGRSAETSYQAYLKEVSTHSADIPQLKDPLGGLHLQKAGYVHLPRLLAAFRHYFLERNSLETGHFQEESLHTAQGIQYKNQDFEALIYCNGTAAQSHPLWHWLPFRPVKGEVLEAKATQTLPYVINRGVFILPTEEQTWRIGATYQWKDLNDRPTEAAKEELLQKMQEIWTGEIQIINHRAGVRPATVDRRPILGKHPERTGVYLFNGLGTKGVSLAPYFANQMAQHLLIGTQIPHEVSIERFFSLYFPSKASL